MSVHKIVLMIFCLLFFFYINLNAQMRSATKMPADVMAPVLLESISNRNKKASSELRQILQYESIDGSRVLIVPDDVLDSKKGKNSFVEEFLNRCKGRCIEIPKVSPGPIINPNVPTTSTPSIICDKYPFVDGCDKYKKKKKEDENDRAK